MPLSIYIERGIFVIYVYIKYSTNYINFML